MSWILESVSSFGIDAPRVTENQCKHMPFFDFGRLLSKTVSNENVISAMDFMLVFDFDKFGDSSPSQK